jgi:hypothetical protein
MLRMGEAVTLNGRYMTFNCAELSHGQIVYDVFGHF